MANKRKRVDDVLTRVAKSTFTSGRGALSGWTTCPLCGDVSRKKFAMGRGIAAHLHAVHAPWKSMSKAERKRQRRCLERQWAEQNKRRKHVQLEHPARPTVLDGSDASSGRNDGFKQVERKPWDPSPAEQDEWSRQVLKIVAELEECASQQTEELNVDRNGKLARGYRDSLPPLLQAAADGRLDQIQALCRDSDENGCHADTMRSLLVVRDRNGSAAEHWAAGGGHLECLRYLLDVRGKYGPIEGIRNTPKKVRRRDGKTCLHYAARNGHVACMAYLLDEGFSSTPDEVSGDGTTPLHLACFGGHLDAVQFLLDRGADAHSTNDWNCGCAHWIAMTLCQSNDQVRRVCRLLQSKGVSFVKAQKQGHSALHKACQKLNRVVIEWLSDAHENGGAGLPAKDIRQAGLPDDGGHNPSAIWRSVGGEDDFAEWIKQKFET